MRHIIWTDQRRIAVFLSSTLTYFLLKCWLVRAPAVGSYTLVLPCITARRAVEKDVESFNKMCIKRSGSFHRCAVGKCCLVAVTIFCLFVAALPVNRGQRAYSTTCASRLTFNGWEMRTLRDYWMPWGCQASLRRTQCEGYLHHLQSERRRGWYSVVA